MCVTIIIKNFDKNIPFILANNRDEMIYRNFVPPTVLNNTPYIVAGKDLAKGGTWLGINQFGIIVNLLNKWKDKHTFFGSDKYRSRGLLVLEILKMKSIKSILSYLNLINYDEYLPFFIILGYSGNFWFIENDNGITIREIEDDLFICGNISPFNKEWGKYQYGYNFLNNFVYKEFNNSLKTVKKLLKVHKGDKNIPSLDYAVNLGDFQTTSSTILFFKNSKVNYYFANGSPINTEYQDYSYLFKEEIYV